MELFKITTLMDNTISGEGIHAEHGLALLIQANNYKLLFDAGQSDLFIGNAEKLGVKLNDVDFVILSHGHYDHTGGLPAFLALNSKAKVVYKDGFFNRRWNVVKEIGVAWPESLIEGRKQVVSGVTEIVPDVFIVADIHICDEKDTHFKNLYAEVNGVKKEDRFIDELFLVAIKDQKLRIITGCAHNGISNIVMTAKKIFPGKEIHSITGGFHLSKETEEVKAHVYTNLKELGVEKFYPMHCSGELHWL